MRLLPEPDSVIAVQGVGAPPTRKRCNPSREPKAGRGRPYSVGAENLVKDSWSYGFRCKRNLLFLKSPFFPGSLLLARNRWSAKAHHKEGPP